MRYFKKNHKRHMQEALPKKLTVKLQRLWETRFRYREVPWELASWSTLTFDLQLAVHLGLSQVIDGLAAVQAAIVRAGLPDLQSTHSLVAKHAVPRVVDDGYLILHPDHFGLQRDNKNISSMMTLIQQRNGPKCPDITPQF